MVSNSDRQTKEMFLWNAALTYHKTSPVLSRLLMSKFIESSKKEKDDYEYAIKPRVQRTMCSSCGSIWIPGNHTVKFSAKSKIPKKIGSLLKREAERSWKLHSVEKNLIKSTVNRRSHLIYHCLHCRSSNKRPLEYTVPIQASKATHKVTPKTPKKARSQNAKANHQQNIQTHYTKQNTTERSQSKSPGFSNRQLNPLPKLAERLIPNVRNAPEPKPRMYSDVKPAWIQHVASRDTDRPGYRKPMVNTTINQKVSKKPVFNKAKKNVAKLLTLLKQSDSNDAFKKRMEMLLQNA